MADHDLKSDESLRAACRALGPAESWPGGGKWKRELAETLARVRSASEAERTTREFQEWLWEHNKVAAIGQGSISVDRALDNPEFRAWLAGRSVEPLPAGAEERTVFLTSFYKDVRERLEPFLEHKTPHLKIFRVMAALFPESMTTVGSGGALSKLARAMGADGKLDSAGRHVWVRQRLDSLLPPITDAAPDQAERMSLPWMLYEAFVEGASEVTQKRDPGTNEMKLLPLPAARRRRGLTAIKGLFPGVLSTLEYVRDGATRAELLDFLRSSSPDSKESSLGVVINALQSELAVIRAQGDRYVLTERGEDVLESQDPEHLADWLLTRILGADRALVELRDGPVHSRDLFDAIRSMNPGWTSDFMPQSILSWYRSMGVVATTGGGKWTLTERGREWASRVVWTPEPLAPEPVAAPASPLPTSAPPAGRGPRLPDLPAILESVQRAGRFPPALVARLHAGLWSHARRHFAVLTGLSGSGKTLLARSYAEAITERDNATRVLTLPVQPGWYDPGALLGYVNPLRGDSYVRTGFLEFLIRAAGDQRNAYLAVLDEMNLSHPEQYMAPLLSAMETGGEIRLHAEDDYFDGIPGALVYPSNLVIIGTVNMDETTHGLSDKVLDRAFVLEFWDISLADYPRWGQRLIPAPLEQRAREVLEGLMQALSPARLHFGWRVVDDVMGFIEQCQGAGEALSDNQALDAAVYAKVLPKLRGDDAPRFRAAVDGCQEVLKRFDLEESATRVADLKRDLETTGSARFWR